MNVDMFWGEKRESVKKKLMSFAGNSVESDCPLFKSVQKTIQKISAIRTSEALCFKCIHPR